MIWEDGGGIEWREEEIKGGDENIDTHTHTHSHGISRTSYSYPFHYFPSLILFFTLGLEHYIPFLVDFCVTFMGMHYLDHTICTKILYVVISILGCVFRLTSYHTVLIWHEFTR